MTFSYFPVLRWKQGEQGALSKLIASDRSAMLPILEVQELAPGIAQPKLAKTLENAAGKTHPLAIDVKEAYNGPVPMDDFAKHAAQLQAAGLIVWPVIHMAHAQADLASLSDFRGQPAVVLRIDPNSTRPADVTMLIAQLRKAIGRRTPMYAVLDLASIGEIQLPALAIMLDPFVVAIAQTGEVVQTAMVGGSFPYALGGYKVGVGNKLPRKELEVWKLLRVRPDCQLVAFGDYGVTNPLPLEPVDPRTLNPSAAIRYTLKNEWWLLRASGVRTKGKGGMGQYNDLCRLLIVNADYCGSTFSYGDGRYDAHAQPGASSGSFMTWRRDATSHHLAYTVRQLLTGNV